MSVLKNALGKHVKDVDQAWQQGCQKRVFSPNIHSEANKSVSLAVRRQVSNAGSKKLLSPLVQQHFWGEMCAVRGFFVVFYSIL
jgi:hypothetical protein